MRIAIHLGHPSQYYIFREVTRLLPAEARVLVSYNDKDVLGELLRSGPYGEEIVRIPTRFGTRNVADALLALLERDAALFRLYRRFRPDVVASTAVVAMHAARLAGSRGYVFVEDDYDVIARSARIGYPAAHALVLPDVVRMPRWTAKQVRYAGYQKLAYLHPARYTPTPVAALGTEPFHLVRTSALRAHHDVGVRGMSDALLRRVVERLAQSGRVLLSSERPLPPDLEPMRLQVPPERMHDVLAAARSLVSDSQSMSVEAAILGVPSVRVSDFAGRLSVLEELEHRYGLTTGVRPDHADATLAAVDALVADPALPARMRAARARMLSDKIDVALWFARLLVDAAQGRAPAPPRAAEAAG